MTEVEVPAITVRIHIPQAVHECPRVQAAARMLTEDSHLLHAWKMGEAIPSNTFQN